MSSKNIITALALTLALGVACDSTKKANGEPASGTPVAEDGPAADAPSATPVSGVGKVLETMDAGGYTYVKLQIGAQQIWAAGPQTAVEVGAEVTIPVGMPMQSFRSKTLDRTFDVIYFVTSISTDGTPPAAAAGRTMPHPKPTVEPTEPVAPVKKAEGGLTVAEIFEQKAELSDKTVILRGRVVKYSAGIMGKNWIHVQDGTGSEGTNDLTVTTDVTATVGDTVLIKGKIATDKDFGAGYKYAVILEDASVTKE